MQRSQHDESGMIEDWMRYNKINLNTPPQSSSSIPSLTIDATFMLHAVESLHECVHNHLHPGMRSMNSLQADESGNIYVEG